MVSGDPGKITELLKAWTAGDSSAQQRLIPLVYRELRRIAGSYRRKAAGSTMQTTEVVHEAYLRLVNLQSVEWQHRAHFFAVSAQLMRRILVDSARARGAAKRGGSRGTVCLLNLDEIPAAGSERASLLIALDDALSRLAAVDPRRAQVVEFRIFAGLSVEESAEVLRLSPQSILRDWKLAKAWLQRELTAANPQGS